jgi:soluble lytic murein transglycosylase-like protein
VVNVKARWILFILSLCFCFFHDFAGDFYFVNKSSAIKSENSKDGRFGSIISGASKHYGLEVALLRAVIKTESNFNPQAISKRGARGWTQLMPGTAREMGVSNIHDPVQNIYGGAKYLAIQMKKFQRKDLALAAYNAGPENVKKGKFLRKEETRKYIKKVIFYEKLYASS